MKNTFGSDKISMGLEQEARISGVMTNISKKLQNYNSYLKNISNSDMDIRMKKKSINLMYDSFVSNSRSSIIPHNVLGFYLNYLKMTKLKTLKVLDNK